MLFKSHPVRYFLYTSSKNSLSSSALILRKSSYSSSGITYQWKLISWTAFTFIRFISYLLRIITHSPHFQVVPDCERHCRSSGSFNILLDWFCHSINPKTNQRAIQQNIRTHFSNVDIWIILWLNFKYLIQVVPQPLQEWVLFFVVDNAIHRIWVFSFNYLPVLFIRAYKQIWINTN